MEKIKSLAERIKIPNKELLKLVAEAGLLQTKVEDEISPEEQKTLIQHIKQKRDEEKQAKTKTLKLKKTASSPSPTSRVQVLRKRKPTEQKRNIEEINAQHDRENTLSEQAKNKQLEKEQKLAQQKDREDKKPEPESEPQQVTETKATPKKQPAKTAEAPKPADSATKKDKAKPKATHPKTHKETNSNVETKPVKKSRKQKLLGISSNATTNTINSIKLNEFVRGKKTTSSSSTNNVPLKSTLLRQGFEKPTKQENKTLYIAESIQVSELAHLLGIKAALLMKELIKLGTMVTINQTIDYDTAELVSAELGKTIAKKSVEDIETMVSADSSDYEHKPRPPIVTVMGHVDHGKTSLLDYIRSTKVVDGESGGITQHIGAYHVETDKGMISFLDTPGHAAFTAMRARGAFLTDIVVLVVAADDKVMPQTIEAIQHAKSANVPIIVAISKIDKPAADPERMMTELSSYELVPEAWGGDTQFIPISAMTGEGIDSLLEAILLQAEILELTAHHQGVAKGIIIESRLDKNRGPIATVLIRQGTLNKGDRVLAGTSFGRIRAQIDENGKPIERAGPSIPVEVLGLDKVPEAGDELIVVTDEKAAKELIEKRSRHNKPSSSLPVQPTDIDQAFANFNDNTKRLNLIIKADTRGSMEAIKHSLNELETEKMCVNLVMSGTGGITETDVSLAAATQSRIIGFHVRANSKVSKQAENGEVKISYYSIIYELINDVNNFLHGLLDPVFEEKILGIAEVRDIFDASKFGKIAGCMVTEGVINRNKPIRVIRGDTVIYEGELESLRRFKDDATQVRAGMECGIGVKGYKDVKTSDRIEVFDKIEVDQRKLSRASQ